jgi:two-component system, sensor histidine kinase
MSSPPAKADWPEPRIRALQVEELYLHAPAAAAFSYFGALITLGVLIQIGDIARGTIWFVWATAVTLLRAICIVGYRRRAPESDPDAWGRLVIASNLLAGIQWGILGSLLFPQGPPYLQLFMFMVIICFVAGSITAYSAYRGAHEALSLPAALPTAIYIFFVQTGVHWYAGIMALFFCFTILYFSGRLNRHMERGFRLQLERDDLASLTEVLNEKLGRENKELAFQLAVKGQVLDRTRERAIPGPATP